MQLPAPRGSKLDQGPKLRRRLLLPAALVAALAAALTLRAWRLSASTAFVGFGSLSTTGRECGVACSAVKSILRRDPYVNDNMQRFLKLQNKLGMRQTQSREKEAAMRRLAKLGLADKIKGLKPQGKWHNAHPSPGDTYIGYYTHPKVGGESDQFQVEITIKEDNKGVWKDVDSESELTITSDFPITSDVDRAMYVFNKYNFVWRDFSVPYPKEEELAYLSLRGLRLFFSQVAQVDGFPSEEEYAGACADADKGMTVEEFLAWLASDDPGWLERNFKNIYTGRRIRIEGTQGAVLDGDFSDEVDGFIMGFMKLQGEDGGTFNVKLKTGEA